MQSYDPRSRLIGFGSAHFRINPRQLQLCARLTGGPPILCGSKKTVLFELLAPAQYKVDRSSQLGRQYPRAPFSCRISIRGGPRTSWPFRFLAKTISPPPRRPISGEHCPSCRPAIPGIFRRTTSGPLRGERNWQTAVRARTGQCLQSRRKSSSPE